MKTPQTEDEDELLIEAIKNFVTGHIIDRHGTGLNKAKEGIIVDGHFYSSFEIDDHSLTVREFIKNYYPRGNKLIFPENSNFYIFSNIEDGHCNIGTIDDTLLFVSKIKHDQLTILDNHQIVKLEDKEICMKILEKSYSKEKAKTSFILTTPIVRLSTEFGLDFSMTLLNFFRTINVETFEDLIKYSENDLENFKILNNRKMGELKNMLIDLDLKLAE